RSGGAGERARASAARSGGIHQPRSGAGTGRGGHAGLDPPAAALVHRLAVAAVGTVLARHLSAGAEPCPAGAGGNSRLAATPAAVWRFGDGHRAGRRRARGRTSRGDLAHADRAGAGLYGGHHDLAAGILAASPRTHHAEHPAGRRFLHPAETGGAPTEYRMLQWLHIRSSTVLFGAGVGRAFRRLMACRRADPPNVHAVARVVVIADWVLTTPTAILQPLTGIYLMRLLGQPITSKWLLWSTVLYVVAIACWLPVVWLQVRMRDIARASAD